MAAGGRGAVRSDRRADAADRGDRRGGRRGGPGGTAGPRGHPGAGRLARRADAAGRALPGRAGHARPGPRSAGSVVRSGGSPGRAGGHPGDLAGRGQRAQRPAPCPDRGPGRRAPAGAGAVPGDPGGGSRPRHPDPGPADPTQPGRLRQPPSGALHPLAGSQRRGQDRDRQGAGSGPVRAGRCPGAPGHERVRRAPRGRPRGGGASGLRRPRAGRRP